VLITGNEAHGRSTGYWARQYRQQGGVDFDDATLSCYLEIAALVSKVFNEERDASTFERAQAILFDQGGPVSKRDQLDRDLLTAWLNFASGAVEWNEQVDRERSPGHAVPPGDADRRVRAPRPERHPCADRRPARHRAKDQ
jgi:hypothetical protein